jgi:hypothetical protein
MAALRRRAALLARRIEREEVLLACACREKLAGANGEE